MSLFSRNPNETAYVGGKKHIADVIKNSGSGDLLIWRQPEEDFNTNSTLIVMPGEEAIFIKGGIIEQTFDNGTYNLSTENYPFIGRLRNAMTGGISTFNCVVYFIRKAHSMEIMWGTDTPIQVRDPKWMLTTHVQARGSYKVQIENGGLFLTKLLGNNILFETQSGLNNYFRNEFSQKIKSQIAKEIQSSNEEIMGICAKMEDFAGLLTPSISEILREYGLKLINFIISGLDIPVNDPSRQKLEEAFANKGVMGILGDDWGRQQAADILKGIANNPGAGGAAAAGAGAGMGMGIGMAAGGVMGSLATEMFRPMHQQPQQPPVYQQQQTGNRFVQKSAPTVNKRVCPSCMAENPDDAKFCNSCGCKLVQEKKYCQNCGVECPPSAKFCNSCGTKLP